MRAERKRRRWKKRRRAQVAAVLGIVLLSLSVAIHASRIWRSAAKTNASERALSEISVSDRDLKLLLDVPFIDQRESWPTGCESVSTVMALQYFDVAITVDEFIDEFLPRGTAPHENGQGVIVGCDPRKAFPGDPRTEGGWGCYAPVIQNALERLVKEWPGAKRLSVEVPLEHSLLELCEEYAGMGIPVLIWATIGMEPPQKDLTFLLEETGEEFQWLYPMHCLVLTGWDDTGYYFNDPMVGKETHYLKKEAEEAYEGLGRQAVALVPVD